MNEKEITLSYDEYCALAEVVDYLENEEERHYEECHNNPNEDNEDHIWHSVLKLKEKLEKHQSTKNK